MSKDFLWTEKFRPHTIEDTILPDNLKQVFQKIVDSGEIPNMLFSGTAGLGKTTVARALCDQLDLDYIVVNGSEEGNIETLRGKIKQFASSVSLHGGYKVVILDEADYLNPQSTQPALRGFIEQFSDNCRFILTCNLKNRIIEPLHSRCGVYEFNTPRKDMGQLCAQFMRRLEWILGEEGVSYDRSVRQWVVNNIDVDTSTIFRGIYDRMMDSVEPNSVPQVVLILADYQYKAAFVADAELNTVACLTELMVNVEFK